MNREIDTSCALARTSVPAVDAILGHAFPALDHGFIRITDYMGDDAAIVQAARVSYGAGTKSVSDDRGLLRYLMRHRHSTPFEMCEIKLHVKLPVFVARQWVRHRTANINEYSARYSILDREFYIPEPAHIAKQSTTNNQGRAAQGIDDLRAEEVRETLLFESERAYQTYALLLDEGEDGDGYGLARELARMSLPTNIYTQWYWKTDLHNLFRFMQLRADAHAQYEIRVYAELICDLVQHWVPLAYEAWCDYQKNAVTFSAQEMSAIHAVLRAHNIDFGENDRQWLGDEGLSRREIDEFLAKMMNGCCARWISCAAVTPSTRRPSSLALIAPT